MVLDILVGKIMTLLHSFDKVLLNGFLKGCLMTFMPSMPFHGNKFYEGGETNDLYYCGCNIFD